MPIHQTDEAELEKAILNGLLFHSANADVEEVAELGQIVNINTFAETGRHAPLNSGEFERGVLMTMADGSEYELRLVKTKSAEYAFTDEVE